MSSQPFSIPNLDAEEEFSYLVFCHSKRSKIMVLSVFSIYFLLFGFLTRSLRQKLEYFESLPTIFQSGDSQWLSYLFGGLIWLVGLALLLYLVWALLDIWGLQVRLSPVDLVVTNTLTGGFLPGIFGVGHVLLDDVVEVYGRTFLTDIKTVTKKVSFSPVDRVDFLIEKLLEYAKNAHFNTKGSS